jgi:TMEM175 potassium channel family protein
MKEKNLELERLVFFCDAVVAIAITLLALDLKVGNVLNGHLRFIDIINTWKSFLAFFLSFLNIASFWKNHHSFFALIKKIDEKLLWYNIFWLFFIVVLPFTTSLVSSYFFDTPAIFIYSLNTFIITIFQNTIWDYVAVRPDFLRAETVDETLIRHMRTYCNLDMINALIAICISFLSPAIAFIFLLTKLPMILIARIFLRTKDFKVK